MNSRQVGRKITKPLPCLKKHALTQEEIKSCEMKEIDTLYD